MDSTNPPRLGFSGVWGLGGGPTGLRGAVGFDGDWYMYKVRMQSHSGSSIFAAADGHPSDWVTLNNPPAEAVFESRAEAEALAALVVAKGYATPSVVAL